MMYQSPVSFEPALPPEAFSQPEFLKQEEEHVFRDVWHLVGTRTQLSSHGKFVTLTLFGIPLVIRNFSGELIALRNVCAHRQSIIAREPSGCSPTLKCPYHGWEYGSDGKTRKLPGAANFPKFKHDHYCLDKYQVDQCGDLVFVRLSSSGPTLREWIGEPFDKIEAWFSPDRFDQSMDFRFDVDANWKIVIEGALESYHIPCIHEKTFYVDPGEVNSEHRFYSNGTSFHTVFLAPRFVDKALRFWEKVVTTLIGVKCKTDYTHLHVFPHLLISRTESLSVAQVVYPVESRKCTSIAIQYGIASARKNLICRTIARSWGKLTASLTRTILAEDRAIFPRVQEGIDGYGKTGLLGRCEERLFASQKYIADRIANGAATANRQVGQEVATPAAISALNGHVTETSQGGEPCMEMMNHD